MSSFKVSYLDSLNTLQRQAVECTEGYIRVLAGAGTGKTKTLTSRYAYLVEMLGLSPSSVLCITFTNKAANEMKERIKKLCGNIASPWVCTFHGFCADFLRQEADVLGYPLNFAILSVPEVKEVLKPIYETLGINGREFSLQDGWEFIDSLKCKDISYVKDMLNEDSNHLLKLASQDGISSKMAMFYLYLYHERVTAVMDFDDLIAFTLTILNDHEEIRCLWQKRIAYMQIDEFQDIDRLQYELVEILTNQYKNLFIVGDPDQTIYTFRGACVKFFTEFSKLHNDTKEFAFTDNYRSQESILDCAYTVISKNPDTGRVHLKAKRSDIKLDDMSKTVGINLKNQEFNVSKMLLAMDGHTTVDAINEPKFEIVKEVPQSFKPILAGCINEDEEADFIARQVKEIKRIYPNRSIAILYRARHVSSKIENALVRYEIPYKVIGDYNFFERREILDVLSFLRLCLNPHDDIAMRRVINVPQRGFGKTRLKRLEADAQDLGESLFTTLERSLDNPFYTKRTRILDFVKTVENLSVRLKQNLSPVYAIELILNDFLYEETLKRQGEKERLESIAQLRQLAYEYQEHLGESCNIADFLSHLVLFTSQDEGLPQDKVVLMTIHNAKGLEFDYVFVAGLNENTFPSTKAVSFSDLEEERRLFYVAITRACRQLFLSSISGGTKQGRVQEPSRFVDDLDEGEILEIGLKLKLSNESFNSDNDLKAEFKVKDKVFHKVFGPGEVIEIKASKKI